jgi:LDH2 family malate/lactate/ureidoglycolate dehydrogenase
MVAAEKSMRVAIEKAEKCGTGWVSTCNSNPLVAPTFSVSRLLGTNPIAVAIPAAKQPPFVADFATTPIARGKLAVAEKKGEKTLLGYVQDKDGKPTDDPTILKSGGSMVTLGGDYEHGSHKGYCLSAIVDIFSAVLSGANFGPFVPPSVAYLPVLDKKVGEGTGHFFGAMRIDAFQPASQFKEKMDEWIETFRNAKSAPGKPAVLIPGDIEREKEIILRKEGIKVVPAIAKDLKEIAIELGIEFEIKD